MNGYLSVIKLPDMTSHDVIRFIKKYLKGIKIGHAGTLDPGAAGVLPVCLGKATKATEYIMEGPKKYRGEITLGITTDTLDGEGKIISHRPVPDLSLSRIKQVLSSFEGEISQQLPAYSAKRYQGKRMYQWTREGKEIEPVYKNVNIYQLRLVEFFKEEYSRLIIDVVCSRGTYIRTLASDVGEKLGTGAFLSFLLRESVGVFNLENSITLEDLQGEEDWRKMVLPVDHGLQEFPGLVVKNGAINYLKNGNWLDPHQIDGSTVPREHIMYRVYDYQHNFWALAQWKTTSKGIRLKPVKLFRED